LGLFVCLLVVNPEKLYFASHPGLEVEPLR